MPVRIRNYKWSNMVLLSLVFIGLSGYAVLAQTQADTATAKLKVLSESPDVDDIVEIRALVEAGAEANDNRANKVEISSKTSAKIIELPFKEGDRVTKGKTGANGTTPASILVRLDSTVLEAELRAAEAHRDVMLILYSKKKLLFNVFARLRWRFL